MDPTIIAFLLASAGIAVWLWHSVMVTRALVDDMRRRLAAEGGFAGGDTGGAGLGLDGGSAGHADGGACGADGGGGGHC